MKTKYDLLARLIACTFLYSILFVSCGDDGDTRPPVINLIDPSEGAVLQIGSPVHFEMEASDNDMLASYKVEIHANFDGHEHARSSVSEEETIAFSYQKSWNISGQKNATIHHHEIEIPENATPGKYHLMVYCTDASGNEAHLARNIVLSFDGHDDEHDDEHGL